MESNIIDYEFWIIPDLVERLQKEIDKANRRAAKVGVGGYELTIGDLTVRKVREEVAPGEFYEWAVPVRACRLVGSSPTIPGHSFVATLEHLDGGTIQRRTPFFRDDEIVLPESIDPKRCDHCHVRRKRMRTYLVADWDRGEFRVVGNECLKSYLGDHRAEHAMWHLSHANSLEDLIREFAPTPGASRYVVVEEWMPLVAAAMRLQDGQYITRAQAEDNARKISGPTACSTNSLAREIGLYVRALAAAPAGTTVQKPRDVELGTDEDRQLASLALEWMRNIPETEQREYLRGLRVAARSTVVDTKAANLLGSGIAAYQRNGAREQYKKAEREAGATSDFLAAPGKRITFTATVVLTKNLDSNWGTTYMYKMRDDAGNLVVWFASNLVGDTVDGAFQKVVAGDKVTLKATVKKHDVYNGTKQTVITRGSLVKVEAWKDLPWRANGNA